MGQYVSKAHSLPLATPGALGPRLTWGIAILHYVVEYISWSGLKILLENSSNAPTEDKSLPSYDTWLDLRL